VDNQDRRSPFVRDASGMRQPIQTERDVIVIRHNKDKFWVCQQVIGMGHYEVLMECTDLVQAQSISDLHPRGREEHIIVRDTDKAWYIGYRTDWHYAVRGKCRTQFGAERVREKVMAGILRK